MSRLQRCSFITVLVTILLLSAIPSLAQVLETPIVNLIGPGIAKQPVVVTAGRSGAPGGFTVWWMKEQDFIANGSQWFPPGDPRQESAHFWGTPTLNVFDGENPTFTLPPLTLITVELGDVADETGLSATSLLELQPNTDYVLCVFANGFEGMEQSDPSESFPFTTLPEHECLRTQGFWKNHWEAWPVFSLLLGEVSYDQDQLLGILHQPVQGNGIISLAHQLIATKLNIAMGADAVDVIETVLAVDALIGELLIPPIGDSHIHPSITSSLTQILDEFNNARVRSVGCVTEWCCISDHICFPTEGETCLSLGGMIIVPDDCDIDYTCDFPTPVNHTTWGTLKTRYR